MELTVETIIGYVWCASEGAFDYIDRFYGMENQADLSAQYFAFREMVKDGLLKDVVLMDVEGNEYHLEEFEKNDVDFDVICEVNPVMFQNATK